ncbi:hypothetical protein HK102_011064 [Quaeritorhiza haematococci]|nr:hypothetical protein HK102_011064 [Quaeritorhiza haematococci]
MRHHLRRLLFILVVSWVYLADISFALTKRQTDSDENQQLQAQQQQQQEQSRPPPVSISEIEPFIEEEEEQPHQPRWQRQQQQWEQQVESEMFEPYTQPQSPLEFPRVPPSPPQNRPTNPLLVDDPAASPKTIASEPNLAFCMSTPVNRQSLWEQHVCEARSKTLQKGCMPQRRWAYNQKFARDVKGVVLIFHGYTACPDAMQWIAHELQNEGYITLTPLTPGHGYPRDGSACDLKGADCIRNTPAGFLPSTLKQYISYVDWAVAMTRQEVAAVPLKSRAHDFSVSVFGLSLGGPLSIIAAEKGKGLFDRVLSVNGLFSLQETGIDLNRSKCLRSENPVECMEQYAANLLGEDEEMERTGVPKPASLLGLWKLIVWGYERVKDKFEDLVESSIASVLLNHNSRLWYTIGTKGTKIISNPFLRWINPLILRQPFGWGGDCETDSERAGYCNFRIKNLFAISAAGLYGLSRVPHLPPKINVAFITTERDGAGRNGLAMAAALESIRTRPDASKALPPHTSESPDQHQQTTSNDPPATTSMCIFLSKPDCDLTNKATANACCMPHSCFARTEALYDFPYKMNWEAELFRNVIDFVRDGTPVGSTTNQRWSGSGEDIKDYCVPVPIGSVEELRGSRFDNTQFGDETRLFNWATKRWKK